MSHTTAFEVILGLMAIALILPMIASKLPLPPAATLVLGGMLLAAIPRTPSIALDPDLVMVLFLPPLLSSGAYFTVWRDFRAEWRPILSLAIGAVIFTTLLVGWVTKQIVPSLPWGACFALGAIVSPPDAVAAKAVLHRLPLPRRVVTILEGESLVNDASGLLLYRIAVAAVATGTFSAGAAVGTLCVLAVGGIAFGFVVGRVTAWVITQRPAPHEVVLISFLASWATYVIADRIGTSGVLAVVTAGLVIGWKQHDILTARSRTATRAVWQFTVSVFESLVFVLIGLALRDVLNRLGGLHAALIHAGPLMMAVVATVIVARLLWVFPAMYLPGILSPAHRSRESAPSFGLGLVSGWAGMRGVVSLAAALALPNDFPGRDVLLFATFGVIAVTVLFQGSTLGWLIRRFVKPVVPSATASLDERAARALIAAAALKEVESMVDGDKPLHPQLIEEYRRRAHITRRVRDNTTDFIERRREHFAAALRAQAAGRAHLLGLHRSGRYTTRCCILWSWNWI